MLRRDPPDVIFMRVPMTVIAHVRLCDPCLSLTLIVALLRLEVALFQLCHHPGGELITLHPLRPVVRSTRLDPFPSCSPATRPTSLCVVSPDVRSSLVSPWKNQVKIFGECAHEHNAKCGPRQRRVDNARKKVRGVEKQVPNAVWKVSPTKFPPTMRVGSVSAQVDASPQRQQPPMAMHAAGELASASSASDKWRATPPTQKHVDLKRRRGELGKALNSTWPPDQRESGCVVQHGSPACRQHSWIMSN